MSKKTIEKSAAATATAAASATAATVDAIMRQHAEDQFAEELAALIESDDKPRPPKWKMSPVGRRDVYPGRESGGMDISRQVHRQTPAQWRSPSAPSRPIAACCCWECPVRQNRGFREHLAAAISGDSTQIVQGTAGTSKSNSLWLELRSAAGQRPLARGPCGQPDHEGHGDGSIARIEELTRMPADVQDSLITILSEKSLPIPELGQEVQATKGFNVIATANNRDKGVNELSSALKRRFNTVILPVPDNAEEEVSIVRQRVAALGKSLEIPGRSPRASTKSGGWSPSSANFAMGRPRMAKASSNNPPAR